MRTGGGRWSCWVLLPLLLFLLACTVGRLEASKQKNSNLAFLGLQPSRTASSTRASSSSSSSRRNDKLAPIIASPPFPLLPQKQQQQQQQQRSFTTTRPRSSSSTALQANFLTSLIEGLLGGDGSAPTPKRKNATETHEVVVIGAGVAGLVCAKELTAQGKDVLLVEAADRVGGRVQTDEYKGFLLDRGFQVFIEAYPAVKRQLDYQALDLQSFWPGALVRADKGFCTVADPFRRPQDLLKGLVAPIGSIGDKIKVALLRLATTTTSISRLLTGRETDTLTYLKRTKGFSDEMIQRFFTPFYQGIYLAPLSEQSSRMFDFVFKMFSEGGISLPARGIRAVPEQLAEALPKGSLRLGVQAKSVMEGQVELVDGTVIAADAVVVATEEATARRLLGKALTKEQAKPLGGRGSTCLYYSFDGCPPIKEPLLILNGETAALKGKASTGGSSGASTGRGTVTSNGVLKPRPKVAAGAAGKKTAPQPQPQKQQQSPTSFTPTPVNNIVFLNSIAPTYAPNNKTLVSVTIVGNPAANDGKLDKSVRDQLSEWFTPQKIATWELLKIYRIPYAQPRQIPPTGPGFTKASNVSEGVFVAGDHRNTATLNGAFESGERAANAVLQHLVGLAPEKRRFKGKGKQKGGVGTREVGRGEVGALEREQIVGSSSSSGAAATVVARSAPSAAAAAAAATAAAAAKIPPSSSSRAAPASFTTSSTIRSREKKDAENFCRFREENERGRSKMTKIMSTIQGRGSPQVRRFREEEATRQGMSSSSGRSPRSSILPPRRPSKLLAGEASRFRDESRGGAGRRPAPGAKTDASAAPAKPLMPSAAPTAVTVKKPVASSAPPPPPPPPRMASSSTTGGSNASSRFRRGEERRR